MRSRGHHGRADVVDAVAHGGAEVQGLVALDQEDPPLASQAVPWELWSAVKERICRGQRGFPYVALIAWHPVLLVRR
jgi:hypothetical protein